MAKFVYGAGNDVGEHPAKQRRHELHRGEIDAILEALNGHATHNAPQTHWHAWTVPRADATIALRRCRLIGRFDDIWIRRSARQ